jgi:hypothetical protein
MSARAPIRPKGKTANRHIHLPSVHIREAHGTGYDYDEDIFIHGRRAERVVRFVAIVGGEATLIRETRDVLCPEELAQLRQDLPVLMDEGNPAAGAIMKECARREFARQLAIAAGEEISCRSCGCSESRACSGGCVWADRNLCSRCV